MTRLKLADLADEKPMRLTVEVSARLHRELLAYAAALNGGEVKGAPSPERLADDRAVHRDRPALCQKSACQPIDGESIGAVRLSDIRRTVAR